MSILSRTLISIVGVTSFAVMVMGPAAGAPIENEDDVILVIEGITRGPFGLGSESFGIGFELSPGDTDLFTSDFMAEVVLTEPNAPTLGSDLIRVTIFNNTGSNGSDAFNLLFLSDSEGPLAIPLGAATTPETGSYQEIASLFVDRRSGTPRTLPSDWSIRVISDVPEPGTLVLLAMGLTAFGMTYASEARRGRFRRESDRLNRRRRPHTNRARR